jgi:hypothetical protein
MREAPVGVLVAFAWALGACGGGSSTQAPTPVATPTTTPRNSGWAAGTVLTIVSAETGSPVAGARLSVAGTPLVTDAAGHATIATAAAEGATLDVIGDAYLSRQTTVKAAVTQIDLWPDDAELPGNYTQRLVYGELTADDRPLIVPLHRLPPNVRRVVLAPSDDIKGQPLALVALREAADRFNVAVRGRVVFALDGTGDMTVPVRISPHETACFDDRARLFARTWLQDHEVTRAELLFCSDALIEIPAPIAHEIGHIYGLHHSIDYHDLMTPTSSSRFLGRYASSSARYGTFSEREAAVMGLIATRRGGNAWPDNDRAAATSSRLVREFID